MLANYGFLLLFLCLITSLYGVISSLLAAKLRHKRLYLSSKMALTATTVMSLMASALLIYSFYQRDYSNLYVMKNSSNDLPALYTLTAFGLP